jgi:hypothetical protein
MKKIGDSFLPAGNKHPGMDDAGVENRKGLEQEMKSGAQPHQSAKKTGLA